MLIVKNISKSYAKSETKAVDNLSMEVSGGEIFGFLGPNGAGKTTTIKLITGILSADEGEISILSRSIRSDPESAKLNIGYVPDNHNVYEKLTGREYLNFLADIYGIDSESRKKRAEPMLERFKLSEAVDSQISTYSHGMKQKICIVGALIHEPKLWILDEPMTGLDPQSAFELKQLMREHTKNGNSVFFSTHILEVAEKLCDRVGIISNGRLIKCGAMNEIKADSSLEDVFLQLVTNNTQ